MQQNNRHGIFLLREQRRKVYSRTLDIRNELRAGIGAGLAGSPAQVNASAQCNDFSQIVSTSQNPLSISASLSSATAR